MLRTVKRRFGRAPLRVTAWCTMSTTSAPASRVQCTVWQIGEGGMFVELPIDTLPETLAVNFELPGHGSHRVVAAPVWSTKTKEAVAAYVKKMKETYRSLQFALALDRPTPQLPVLLRETELDRIRDR